MTARPLGNARRTTTQPVSTPSPRRENANHPLSPSLSLLFTQSLLPSPIQQFNHNGQQVSTETKTNHVYMPAIFYIPDQTLKPLIVCNYRIFRE